MSAPAAPSPIRLGKVPGRQADALVYGFLVGSGGFASDDEIGRSLRVAGCPMHWTKVAEAVRRLEADGLVVRDRPRTLHDEPEPCAAHDDGECPIFHIRWGIA